MLSLFYMEFQLILLSVLLRGENNFTDITYDFVIPSGLHFLFAHLDTFSWNTESKLVEWAWGICSSESALF